MNSNLDDFLDYVDVWKFKLHDKLKGMSPAQRKAFWNKTHEEARARGLNVVDAPVTPVTPVTPEVPEKRPAKRVRRTG